MMSSLPLHFHAVHNDHLKHRGESQFVQENFKPFVSPLFPTVHTVMRQRHRQSKAGTHFPLLKHQCGEEANKHVSEQASKQAGPPKSAFLCMDHHLIARRANNDTKEVSIVWQIKPPRYYHVNYVL